MPLIVYDRAASAGTYARPTSPCYKQKPQGLVRCFFFLKITSTLLYRQQGAITCHPPWLLPHFQLHGSGWVVYASALRSVARIGVGTLLPYRQFYYPRWRGERKRDFTERGVLSPYNSASMVNYLTVFNFGNCTMELCTETSISIG